MFSIGRAKPGGAGIALGEGFHADETGVTESQLLQGLPARIGTDCRVLVLGSMPGAASLQQARYYAHPRNRFWPLMGELLGIDAQAGYEQRVSALLAAGVGLWDVIGQCRRVGSLDAAIVRGSIVANPLPARIAALPALRAVACNGAEAHRAWLRWIAPALPVGQAGLQVLALPSTSPANAAFGLARLAAEWGAITGLLEPGPGS